MDADQTIEHRLRRLENAFESNSKDMGNILLILKKVETRMLGDLDTEQPGILDDLRRLKKESETSRSDIVRIDTSLSLLNNSMSISKQMFEDFNQMKKSVENFQRYKWVVSGILMTVGFLLSYLTRFWSYFIPPHKGP